VDRSKLTLWSTNYVQEALTHTHNISFRIKFSSTTTQKQNASFSTTTFFDNYSSTLRSQVGIPPPCTHTSPCTQKCISQKLFFAIRVFAHPSTKKFASFEKKEKKRKEKEREPLLLFSKTGRGERSHKSLQRVPRSFSTTATHSLITHLD